MSDKLPSNPTAKIQRIYELVSVPAPLLLHEQEQEHGRRQAKKVKPKTSNVKRIFMKIKLRPN